MKKLLLLLVIGGALWHYRYQLPWGQVTGTINPDGSAKTIFITAEQCGKPCEQMEAQLKNLHVSYERKSFNLEDSSQLTELLAYTHGSSQFPGLVIGAQVYLGYNPFELPFNVADGLGLQYLPRAQADIIGQSHFNADGSKKVIVYGTAWCPYCKKARELLGREGVAYEDVDVEQSTENMYRFKTLGGGGYPLLFVGARALSGFDARKLHELIEER